MQFVTVARMLTQYCLNHGVDHSTCLLSSEREVNWLLQAQVDMYPNF